MDVALHLDQGDRARGLAAVRVEHRIRAVLPALVREPGLGCAGVAEESVAVGSALALDPGHRCQQGRPQGSDQGEVPGAVGVGARQHHEQGCRVDAAVVAAEGQLLEPRHLALAGLVHDLARGGVREVQGLGSLVRGEEAEDPLCQRRVEPERLQRGDDRVAAERGREPGDARVGVRTRRELGSQERQIGARLAEPLVEHAAGAADGGAALPQ